MIPIVLITLCLSLWLVRVAVPVERELEATAMGDFLAECPKPVLAVTLRAPGPEPRKPVPVRAWAPTARSAQWPEAADPYWRSKHIGRLNTHHLKSILRASERGKWGRGRQACSEYPLPTTAQVSAITKELKARRA